MRVTNERLTHAEMACEWYWQNMELLGWAHSIINAESPEDGNAGLLKPGDRLDTWPRLAAKALRDERALADRLAEALRGLAIATDPMSWHGEAIICELCGGHGERGGRKRGVADSPVVHAETCALAAYDKSRGKP